MGNLVLVTDSTADIPEGIAAELGIRVARATYALGGHALTDGEQPLADFYGQMARRGEMPDAFGTAESAFRAIFKDLLDGGDEPFCIVTPFGVNPSFTTAIAALMSFDDAHFKIINAGVASAGLCSLIVALAEGVRMGVDRDGVLAALEASGPRCDTLFVPADPAYLASAGRLQAVEQKLGELDGRLPVVRVATRITAVSAASSFEEAIDEAVSASGVRAGPGTPLIVTIDHAINPAGLEAAKTAVAARLNVARLIVTELSATIGAQLGPGAVGIGVAPVLKEMN